ncbi:hypothetical protein AGMMS49574_22230 [Bacteroidia bacterium]|nr:hypothetical protein AGMMS49574_22230 [Bacteroidia bacterium]
MLILLAVFVDMLLTLAIVHNTGKISISSSYYANAGGICGISYSSQINACIVANASIISNGTIGTREGRIVGDIYFPSIVDCYALASILINSSIRNSQDATSNASVATVSNGVELLEGRKCNN